MNHSCILKTVKNEKTETNIMTSSVCTKYTVCLKKNIPDIFSCNFRKHCRIFIIFGTHVLEKASNQ